MNSSKNVIKMIDALNILSSIFAIFLVVKFAAYSGKLKYWRMNDMGNLANEFVATNIFLIIFVALVITVLYKVRDNITGDDRQNLAVFDKTMDNH